MYSTSEEVPHPIRIGSFLPKCRCEFICDNIREEFARKNGCLILVLQTIDFDNVEV